MSEDGSELSGLGSTTLSSGSESLPPMKWSQSSTLSPVSELAEESTGFRAMSSGSHAEASFTDAVPLSSKSSEKSQCSERIKSHF